MKKLSLTLLCLTAVFFAACANKEDIAVIVNDTPITTAFYKGTLQNLASSYQQVGQPNVLDNPQNRQLLQHLALQQLITNEVLAQEAQKQNIKIDEALVKQNVDQLKQLIAGTENGKPVSDKKIINQKFQAKLKQDGTTLAKLENNIRKELQRKSLLTTFSNQQKIELQEQDIRRFYDNVMILLGNNQQKKDALPKDELPLLLAFAKEVKRQTAERVMVASVFLATPNDISESDLDAKQQQAGVIVKELKENQISFTDAIIKYSDDKNALKTNGEQLVLRGTLPAALDKSIFNAELGTIVGPITQPEGIYIIRVNEKRAATKPTYTQLRGSIARNLAEIQIKQNIQQYVQDLINKAKVEIVLPELKEQTPSDPQK